MEKIKKEFGIERVEAWLKEHNLMEVLGPVKKEKEPSELKPPKILANDQTIPSKHKQNPLPSSNQQPKKKFVKKSKSSNGGDEIDDIFSSF